MRRLVVFQLFMTEPHARADSASSSERKKRARSADSKKGKRQRRRQRARATSSPSASSVSHLSLSSFSPSAEPASQRETELQAALDNSKKETRRLRQQVHSFQQRNKLVRAECNDKARLLAEQRRNIDEHAKDKALAMIDRSLEEEQQIQERLRIREQLATDTLHPKEAKVFLSVSRPSFDFASPHGVRPLESGLGCLLGCSPSVDTWCGGRTAAKPASGS